MFVHSIAIAAVVAGADVPATTVIKDDRSDDFGPGGYIYPGGGEYRRGDFDLLKLEVVPHSDVVEFRVTLGAPVRRYLPDKRTLASDIELTNGVQVQNIDIYIDTDGRPGSGYTDGLPGRRVTIGPDGAWDVAIVISPQPYQARTVIERAMPPDAAAHVIVPSDVVVDGPTATARVPVEALGGAPQPTWGYAVMVSGAIWLQSFELVPRLVGDHRPNAFTMPVLGVAEQRAFGGGDLGSYEPWVIDITTPPGQSQRAILSSYSESEKRFAVVPMVYPGGRPSVPAAPAGEAALAPETPPAAPPTRPLGSAAPVAPAPDDGQPRVVNVQDEWLTIKAAPGTVQRFWLGSVLDANGQLIARIVVTKVTDDIVVAQVLEKTAPISPGARVRFGSNKESETRHD